MWVEISEQQVDRVIEVVHDAVKRHA